MICSPFFTFEKLLSKAKIYDTLICGLNIKSLFAMIILIRKCWHISHELYCI